MMEAIPFILCNTLCESLRFFLPERKNKMGCANKPRKLEGRKEQFARQLWKTSNCGNEEGTENAPQREDTGQDSEKIGRTQKVKEKKAWKGLLHPGGKQDWVKKIRKVIFTKPKKKKSFCFWVSIDWSLGTAADKAEPLVFTCPKFPQTSVFLWECKAGFAIPSIATQTSTLKR